MEERIHSVKIDAIPPVATVRMKKLKFKGKELKRQIIVTYKLMMDDVRFLSILHNARTPNFDQFETLSFNTDNNVFLTTMDGVIDGLAEFFASLPDVSLKGGSQELDAIESLLELGQRLEILILKLEYSTSQGFRLDIIPKDNGTIETFE